MKFAIKFIKGPINALWFYECIFLFYSDHRRVSCQSYDLLQGGKCKNTKLYRVGVTPRLKSYSLQRQPFLTSDNLLSSLYYHLTGILTKSM